MSRKAPEATKVEPRLLTVAEAARYLGLSPRTLYNGVARKSAKRFPVRAKRIGRAVRFDKRELDAYLDSLGADG